MASFSERQGFLQSPQIAYRDELPLAFRLPIYEILRRHIPARALLDLTEERLNPYGLLSLPYYKGDLPISKDEDRAELVTVKRVLAGCDWFRIYDLIEDVFASLSFHEEELADDDEEPRALPMQAALNEYFIHAGIGWQMVDGKILVRLDPIVQTAIANAVAVLAAAQLPTAAQHLESAVKALSERPAPNTPGAVAHATSAIECVLDDFTGSGLSLGKYLDKFPNLFHPALKKALDGVYGFASDAGARHGREGLAPSRSEAHFAVTTCAAACAYLSDTLK